MWLGAVGWRAMLYEYAEKALASNIGLVFNCDYENFALLIIFIHKTGTILP
jgi:hypothetical protein